METIISFVRHGEVSSSVFYGRLPWIGLNSLGRKQAGAAARVLDEINITAIFSSPMLRTRQTARIIAGRHAGLKLSTSSLLNEVYSPFDGTPWQVIESRKWDAYTGTSAPYEQPQDVVRRVNKFIAAKIKQFPGGRLVAITHGDLIAFLVLAAQGRPLTVDEKQKMRYPLQGSITTFTFKDGNLNNPGFTYCQPEMI